MLTKRIIPCLDIKDGRTVKGTNFLNLRDAGDPVELAKRYVEEGADELVFLDISATNEERATLLNLVEKIAEVINIPFAVGGGVKTVEDISNLLKAGADKVSINTAGLNNPDLIKKASEEFGNQCIVVAIDAKQVLRKVNNPNVVSNNSSLKITEITTKDWFVHTHGGTRMTNILALQWAKKVEELGAGEILLTSMDKDGTKSGFDLEITKLISDTVNIPVIASGGAGKKEHFLDVFEKARADAGLAASIFHFQEVAIPDLKKYLKKAKQPIRIHTDL